jgi:AcrR family transcriptional regulator
MPLYDDSTPKPQNRATSSAAKAEATRERILNAATHLFRRYGAAKTTVVDIARCCRMSSANVYRFFPSKAALTEAVCRIALSDLEASLLRVATSEDAALARIARIMQVIAQFSSNAYREDRKTYDMVAAAVEQHSATIREHIRVVDGVITEVIANGIAAGELPEQARERAAPCLAFVMLGYWPPFAATRNAALPGLPTTAEIVAFVTAALISPGAAVSPRADGSASRR